MDRPLLGVSDLLSVVGVAIGLGFALFLRELHEDLTAARGAPMCDGDGGPPIGRRPSWCLVVLRALVRVSGSSVGAWLAAAACHLAGLYEVEILAAGLGGAMGWKVVDAMQSVFWERLAEILRGRLK